MDRLKRSVLKNAVRSVPLTDGTKPVPAQQSSGMLTTWAVHANIGGLGISNSALGDEAHAALPICVTTLGDQALMSELGDVRFCYFPDWCLM